MDIWTYQSMDSRIVQYAYRLFARGRCREEFASWKKWPEDLESVPLWWKCRYFQTVTGKSRISSFVPCPRTKSWGMGRKQVLKPTTCFYFQNGDCIGRCQWRNSLCTFYGICLVFQKFALFLQFFNLDPNLANVFAKNYVQENVKVGRLSYHIK